MNGIAFLSIVLLLGALGLLIRLNRQGVLRRRAHLSRPEWALGLAIVVAMIILPLTGIVANQGLIKGLVMTILILTGLIFLILAWRGQREGALRRGVFLLSLPLVIFIGNGLIERLLIRQMIPDLKIETLDQEVPCEDTVELVNLVVGYIARLTAEATGQDMETVIEQVLIQQLYTVEEYWALYQVDGAALKPNIHQYGEEQLRLRIAKGCTEAGAGALQIAGLPLMINITLNSSINTIRQFFGVDETEWSPKDLILPLPSE